MEDLEEYHATHLALVRRGMIMQQSASLSRQHSAHGVYQTSTSSASDAAVLMARNPLKVNVTDKFSFRTHSPRLHSSDESSLDGQE